MGSAKDNKISFSSFTCNNPKCVNCIAIHTPPGITPVNPIKYSDNTVKEINTILASAQPAINDYVVLSNGRNIKLNKSENKDELDISENGELNEVGLGDIRDIEKDNPFHLVTVILENTTDKTFEHFDFEKANNQPDMRQIKLKFGETTFTLNFSFFVFISILF